jgi:hypothetical protein
VPKGASAAVDLFAMIFTSIVEISFTFHLRASLVPMKTIDRKLLRSAGFEVGFEMTQLAE